MTKSIYQILQQLGSTSLSTRKLYNSKTRDNENLEVWRDEVSGVIYIDKFYTGDETYKDGSYRFDKREDIKNRKLDTISENDLNRRFNFFFNLFNGKRIGDFGCGYGDFLRRVNPHCEEVVGIELDKKCQTLLDSKGIKCVDCLAEIENNSLDHIFLFHVLEHLPDPIKTLGELKKKIISGGTIILEVPHANDFLLSFIKNDDFKQFTLWSQHLILHTKESLYQLLDFVGMKDIEIDGIQRYPLSNHLNWIKNGKPGGHETDLSVIDNRGLSEIYEISLNKINATDTLIATAKKP